MGFVVAALVLVATLAAINLVFTLGVVRRLREHEADMATLRGGAPGGPVMLAPGSTVADFSATTVDGAQVSRSTLDGVTLVGFFSTHCQPCKERVPQFVEFAGDHPGGRAATFAVIVGDDEDTATEFTAALSPIARVARDTEDGPISKAFDVQGYPALALVDADATIRASGFDLAALTAVTTA